VVADGQLEQLRLYYTQPKIDGQAVAAPVLKAEAGFAWEALSPCLRMLGVSGCVVAAPLVQSLAQLLCLASLSFVQCNFGNGISELASAIGKLTSLHELEFEGSAVELGSDAAKNMQQLQAVAGERFDPLRPAALRALAPAASAIAWLLDIITRLGSQEQLRSLRLSLGNLPPVCAVGYAASATQKKPWAPWAARVAAASRLTRLALGRHMLDDMDDAWLAKLAPKLTRLQVSAGQQQLAFDRAARSALLQRDCISNSVAVPQLSDRGAACSHT
jgi:hypothetical protein